LLGIQSFFSMPKEQKSVTSAMRSKAVSPRNSKPVVKKADTKQAATKPKVRKAKPTGNTSEFTTKPKEGDSLEKYLQTVDDVRKPEIETLHNLIRKAVPQLAPSYGSTMIGFGSYHYKYASGREGDAPIIALSSRKNYISLYVLAACNGMYVAETFKPRLPKAKIGKSCVTFKKLADVDLTTITELVKEGAKVMAEQGYGI